MNDIGIPKTAAEAIRDGLQTIEMKVDTLLLDSTSGTVMDEGVTATLKTLQLGVEQLVETDSARRDEMEFLADVRTKMVEALTILHEQLGTLMREVKILRAPAAPKPRSWWKTYGPWGGGLAAGLVVAMAVWMAWPSPAYKGIAVALHGVLHQTYAQLPRGVQEQVRAVYRQHNFVEPGQK